MAVGVDTDVGGAMVKVLPQVTNTNTDPASRSSWLCVVANLLQCLLVHTPLGPATGWRLSYPRMCVHDFPIVCLYHGLYEECSTIKRSFWTC